MYRLMQGFRTATRPAAALVILSCLILLGCQDTNAPQTGAVRVRIATSGFDLDLNGYSIRLDSGETQALSVDEVERIMTGIPVGQHRLHLDGIRENCTVAAGVNATFEVVANDTTDVAFAVTCARRVGRIRVITTTTGTDRDDGYYVTVFPDSSTSRVEANGTTFIDNVPEGSHPIQVDEVAWNCGASPVRDTVVVTYGGTTDVSFAVNCTPRMGTVRVITVTTGTDIDTDGYEAWAYYYLGGRIGVNDTLTFDLYVGANDIYLHDVAQNCQVDHYAQRAEVVGGDTVDVTFNVVCSPWSYLNVFATTTGVDPDADGYRAHVQRTSMVTTLAVPANGRSETFRTRSGPVAVEFAGTSVNCSITSPAVVSVNVPEGDTVTIPLEVACVEATRLAFARWQDDGNSQIYSVKSNGAGLTQLTNHASRNFAPAWSPDRSRIAFQSSRAGTDQIFVMNADGSSQIQLTVSAARNHSPRWSPDGSKILFVSSRDGNDEVYVMSANGSAILRLTMNASRDYSPDWSPDGTRIVFISDRTGVLQLHTMNADGTQPSRVPVNAIAAGEVRWAPDGNRLAFSEWLGCDYYCYNGISVVNVDGSALTQLTGNDDYSPSWSPDGVWIGYSTGSGAAIAAVRVSDGARREIFNAPAITPAWWR